MSLIFRLNDKDGVISKVLQIPDTQDVTFNKGSTEDGKLPVIVLTGKGDAQPVVIPLHGDVAMYASCGTHLGTIPFKSLKG